MEKEGEKKVKARASPSLSFLLRGSHPPFLPSFLVVQRKGRRGGGKGKVHPIFSSSFPEKWEEGEKEVRERASPSLSFLSFKGKWRRHGVWERNSPPICLLPWIERNGRREGGKRTASPSLSFPSPKGEGRIDGCKRTGLPFSLPRLLTRTKKETGS